MRHASKLAHTLAHTRARTRTRSQTRHTYTYEFFTFLSKNTYRQTKINRPQVATESAGVSFGGRSGSSPHLLPLRHTAPR